jgi:hypothetical protein
MSCEFSQGGPEQREYRQIPSLCSHDKSDDVIPSENVMIMTACQTAESLFVGLGIDPAGAGRLQVVQR